MSTRPPCICEIICIIFDGVIAIFSDNCYFHLKD